MNQLLEQAWETFQLPLKSFLRKRVNQEKDVDDLLQDIFMKIQKNINTLSDHSRMKQWVFQIARNTLIDYYRNKEKSAILLNVDSTMSNNSFANNLDNYNNDIIQWIKNILPRLPSKYKEAVIMSDFQHVPQTKIACILGLSIPGSKSRVQRGRKKIQTIIETCCDIEHDAYGNITSYKFKKNNCDFCNQ